MANPLVEVDRKVSLRHAGAEEVGEMSAEKWIRRDATRVARKVVKSGFWIGHERLSESNAAKITRDGTLLYADLRALKKLVGRTLTKADHWLWETTLRAELCRLAPLESSS